MNALRVASQILGDMDLSSGQLAQLQALNRKYAQRVYSLTHQADTTKRELTDTEVVAIQAQLRSDILALLTPEQQSLLQK